MRQRIQNHCACCGKRIPSGLDKCLACSLNLKSRTRLGEVLCRVCGSNLNMKDKICSTCGTNFLEEESGTATEEETVEYICMICGSKVSKYARRCDLCGTVFVEDAESYSGPVVEKVSGRLFASKATPRTG